MTYLERALIGITIEVEYHKSIELIIGDTIFSTISGTNVNNELCKYPYNVCLYTYDENVIGYFMFQLEPNKNSNYLYTIKEIDFIGVMHSITNYGIYTYGENEYISVICDNNQVFTCHPMEAYTFDMTNYEGYKKIKLN